MKLNKAQGFIIMRDSEEYRMRVLYLRRRGHSLRRAYMIADREFEEKEKPKATEGFIEKIIGKKEAKDGAASDT